MNSLKDMKIKNALRCPVCKSKMDTEERGSGILFCSGAKRHSYDFASDGYVNLAPPAQSNGGDSKGAVRARTAFLQTGYYRPIADKLCEMLAKYCASGALVVDAGCGEGYYSTLVSQKGFSVAGFDLSKFAVDAGAKRAKREELENTFFGVASVYTLPLADKSADAVVNVFAPCVEQEYSRVLADDGILVVVYAGPDHLLGLKGAIYERTQTNEERADLPSAMQEIGRERLSYSITVEGNQNAKDLFAMTPYYWKTSQKDMEKLEQIERLETEVDIIFAIYKKIVKMCFFE